MDPGRIADLKVCENIAEHLIGNVYIRFESSGTARRAVDDLNRRWFARQPIYAELSPVTDFRDACCRQHEIGECNRAGFCNFLHIKQPSVRVMARIREERAVRTDREHSPSSSLMSSSSSECSFASDSESSASSEPSVASMHSNLGDDSDVLPKIYRLEASSSSDEESDSDASLWGRRAPASLEASEDSDPNSRTPRAFRPTADESSDDAEMSDSEREMLRRRKQKLRRQRWEQLRVELSPKWDEDRERNFVFSLL
ncbi:hypothetical protein QR680_009513 [Steinernema hermaphroditum]|uniref:C3H1-type domain-containing protein n=1 Tax=Steinernema hermaphroditum TaxID=289476 RepID=A0AA39MA07_9BILA|nr:hypothetical protein QR680_009513 [Steinernema hermaphroditum]